MAAVFAILIAVTATVGAVVATVQRPTASPPLPTPFRVPTFPPTPVPSVPVLGFGFSAVDDPAIHRVVVFGGVDSYDTTWLWDGRRWALAHPRSSPPGRFGAAIAYDSATRVVMLFGGRLAPGQVVNDTWAWDGTTWRLLDNGVNGPPPGEVAQMAWDDARAQMMLVTRTDSNTGGETWTWSASHWTRESKGELAVDPASGPMAFDPLSRALLMVVPAPPDGAHSWTMRWDGSSWRVVNSSGPAVAAMALDPRSGVLTLYCAPTCMTPAGVEPTMWGWTGKAWLPRAGPPPPFAIEAEVTDTDRSELLILGSEFPPTQSSPQPVAVWSWNGAGWGLLEPA
jgi:hypothetical protein